MNSAAPPPFTEAGLALAFGLLLLAPLAIAGVCLINAGLGRSRSAAHSLLGSLVMISVAVLVFALVGAALAGGLPGHGFVLHLAGKPWDWAGAGPLMLGGLAAAPPRAQLAVLFEVLALALAVIIPWGSGADRLRLSAGAACSAALALAFSLVAHWVWGGGWLAQLGINFSLGAGFLDAGGAAAVHVLGGLSALVVVWIAGSRRGKFPREGLSTAMPGHNAAYVLFGCLLALVGWLAWNTAGALLWLSAAPAALLPVTALNTLLSAAAALCGTFAITRIRFGKPDASLCANGWLAGLVASSACAGIVTPSQAILTGLVAGIGAPLLVEVLELAASIDDPSGAIAVHGAGGLWGLIAAGLFAPQSGQLVAQLIGVATLLGLLLPLVYLLFWVLNRLVPFRADAEGERIGMDLHELGGSAYPEFVIHRDDSYR